MLTDVLASRRRRRQAQDGGLRILSQSDAQLYRELAQASGGQAIEVSKSDLVLATSVIEDSSAPAVVRPQRSNQWCKHSPWCNPHVVQQ